MALASISIRQFTPQNIESLNSFFKAIVESGLDTWFHPHPFDMKHASLICNYKGENWSAGAFVKEPGGNTLPGRNAKEEFYRIQINRWQGAIIWKRKDPFQL